MLNKNLNFNSTSNIDSLKFSGIKAEDLKLNYSTETKLKIGESKYQDIVLEKVVIKAKKKPQKKQFIADENTNELIKDRELQIKEQIIIPKEETKLEDSIIIR